MILDQDKLTAAEKLRIAIAHCCKTVLELHAATAVIYGKNPSLADLALPRDLVLLESLIQHLDASDALMHGDGWVIEALIQGQTIAKGQP